VGAAVNGIQIGSNSPVCTGSALFISATNITGVSYTWVGPNALTNLASSVSISSASSLESGVYSIRASSPGCPDYISSLSVLVNTPIVPVAGSPGTPYCQGSTLELTVNGNSGMSFNWIGPNGFSSSQQNPRIINVIPANSGIYSVFINQPGCGVASSTVSTLVGPALTNFTASSNSPVCIGGTLNVSATALSGVAYNWTGPNSFNSNQSSFSISPVQVSDAGNYSLTVVSPGCGSVSLRVKVELNLVTGISISTNSPVCAGSVLNLNGTGSRGSTFQWVGPTGYISSNASATISNTQVIHGGVYTLTVNDPACGAVQLTTTVQVGANLNSLSIGANTPVCVGGALQLSALGVNGASYNWSGPNAFVSTAQFPIINNITSNTAGVYTLSASTPGCFTVTRTMNVAVSPSLTVIPGSNSPICQGNALYLTSNMVTNATYAWVGPNGFTSNSASPSITNVQPLNSGVYTMTITTVGCGSSSSTTSVTIGGNTGNAVLASNSPVCVGNNINLSVSSVPGGTYSWNGPNGFNSMSQYPVIAPASALHAGQYTMVVSSPGCVATTRTINVVVNPAIALSTGSNSPICQGSVLYLSAGTITGASYAWTGPNSFASTSQNPSISNAQPIRSGIYTLTVNSPSCGVVATTTAVIVNSNLSSIVATSNSPVCLNNSLNLTVTNRQGYTFTWAGPNGFTSAQAQPVINPATSQNAGAYSVTISSAGCGSVTRTISSVIVNDPTTVQASSNSPVCVGTVIYLNGTAPIGSTFAWTGPGSWSASGPAPARSNAQLSMAGLYTMNATVPGCGAISRTVNVLVNSCRQSQNQDVVSGSIEQAFDEEQSIESSHVIPTSVVENTSLTVWPNPNAGNTVNLKWDGLAEDESEITIRVYDVLGSSVYLKTIQKGNNKSFETTIDFWKHLSKGVYSIETAVGNQTLHQKLIIQ
jgi:hypothetical protein